LPEQAEVLSQASNAVLHWRSGRLFYTDYSCKTLASTNPKMSL